MDDPSNCNLCGGKLKTKLVKLDLWVDNSLIVIESVPAEVCLSCGEEMFDPQTSKRIDQIAKGRENSHKKMTVQVFSLAA